MHAITEENIRNALKRPDQRLVYCSVLFLTALNASGKLRNGRESSLLDPFFLLSNWFFHSKALILEVTYIFMMSSLSSVYTFIQILLKDIHVS